MRISWPDAVQRKRILYESLLLASCVLLPLFLFDLLSPMMTDSTTTTSATQRITESAPESAGEAAESTAALIRNKADEVARNQAAVDRLDNWQLRWLAAVAIAGIASLLIPLRLRTSTTSLDRSKSELAALELKQIEENRKVAIARVEADSRKEVARLREEADAAKRDSEARIAELQKATAEANQRAAEAQLALEAERVKGQDVLKAIAKRRLPARSFGREGLLNFGRIKPFAGVKAIIEYVPDAEARRAAEEIANCLKDVGWIVAKPMPNEHLWRSLTEEFWDSSADGVVAEYFPWGATPDGIKDATFGERSSISSKSGSAAKAFAQILRENGWREVRDNTSKDEKYPIDTVRIRVGFKPEPIVLTAEESERGFERPTIDDRPVKAQREVQRAFTPEQRDKIIKGVNWKSERYRKAHVYPAPITILCPKENPEACAFAEEIAGLLKEIGWYEDKVSVVQSTDFPRRLEGLRLRPGGYLFASRTLAHAMRGAGVEIADVIFDAADSEQDPLRLYVGW